MVGVGVGCYQRDRRLLVIAWEWRGKEQQQGRGGVGERIHGAHTIVGAFDCPAAACCNCPPPTLRPPFKTQDVPVPCLAILNNLLMV